MELKNFIVMEAPVFFYLLLVLLVAASIHVALMRDRTMRRAGEIFLLYILVGYCGVPQLALGLWGLASPDRVAAMLGFPAGSPFQDFTGASLVGMSVLSLLALRYRGTFLLAPAVCWSVFFAGATYAHLRASVQHLQTVHHGAGPSHAALLHLFATHGLISVLLVGALIASGAWREKTVP